MERGKELKDPERHRERERDLELELENFIFTRVVVQVRSKNLSNI